MVRRALAAVLGELALAMVGISPVSDSAAAPSLVGSTTGGGLSADQEAANAAEDCPLDRLSSVGQQQETESNDALCLTPIEETPEVREAWGHIVSTLVPIFNGLAFNDEQESVRLIALEVVVPLVRALGPTLAEQHVVVPGLAKILDFKSWRSRCLLAKKITQLQICLGPRVTKNCLIVSSSHT